MTTSKMSSIFKSKPATRRSGKQAADTGRKLTSERIEADLEAFEKSGGEVEVLGTTRVLTKVDELPADQVPLPAAAPKGRSPAR